MKQIICIHVGQKYSNEYVVKLFNACLRHNSDEFIFTVLHDNKTYSIEHNQFRTLLVEPIAGLNHFNLWWYKLQAFSPNVTIDNNLLLDLDLVVTAGLDKFWVYEPNKFVLIQDFNRHWVEKYPRSNSSVVKFNKDTAKVVWEIWKSNEISWVRKYRGDQDFFDDEIKNKIWWPKSWVQSWKWEVYRGGLKQQNTERYWDLATKIPSGCSIIAFHGVPNPHEVKDGIIQNHWI